MYKSLFKKKKLIFNFNINKALLQQKERTYRKQRPLK